MIQSIILYSLVIISLITLSIDYNRRYDCLKLKINKINFKDPEIWLIILIYTLFSGLRFDVGVDYFEYYNEYISVSRYSNIESLNIKEPLWALYTWFLSKNKIHFTIYFCIIAFIQIVLLIGCFKDQRKIFPYVIFVFFICGYFINFQNVIRQNIVMLIFLYVVLQKREIKLYKYLIIIIICFCIHKSSILLLFLYPLIRIKPLDILNKFYLVIFYLACCLIGYSKNIFEYLSNSVYFINLISNSSYSAYSSMENLSIGIDKSIGIGFFFKIIAEGIIIYNVNKFKNISINKISFLYSFWFFYIGTCLHYLVPTSRILGRPILYFTFFSIPITSYFIKYSINNFKYTHINSYIRLFSVFILVLLFIQSHILHPEGYKAEYKFFWDLMK